MTPVGTGSFRDVLALPGALKFSAAGVLGRFELAMGSLGVVLLVVGSGGSYTVATILTAAHALAVAIVNPYLSRLVDRHGQRKVALPQVAVYIPAVIGLVTAVALQAPLPLLVAVAVVEGASHPMVMSLVRARWSWILRGKPGLKTAFAWESMIDAAIIAVGAPLATFLAVQVFPAAALLVAGASLSVSVLLLLAQRGTEPPPFPRSTSRSEARGLPPGIILMVVITGWVGANLGAFDIAALGRANELGQPQLAGWILAVYAIGSTIGGTVLGRYFVHGSLTRQYLVLLVLLSLGVIPMVFLDSASWLVGCAFIAGVFIAPTLITGMTIVEAISPLGRVTESLAWTLVGVLVGRSVGQLAAGRIVDVVGAGAAFALVSVVAAVACLCVAGSSRRLNALIEHHRIRATSIEDPQSASCR